MALDLTAHIQLNKKSSVTYRVLQVVFYLSAISLTVYFAVRILFPTSYFGFDFSKPSAKSNTLTHLQNDLGVLPDRGNVSPVSPLFFNASLFDFFSKAQVTFLLDKKSAELDADNISVRKSHSAFLYPDGAIFGFKNGTLLKWENSYYIISNNKLRKFANAKIVADLGYAPEAFLNVPAIELRYHKLGKAIPNSRDYPDKTLFKIAEDYYLLQNNHLQKFISTAAFLSQYDPSQAISKNPDLFARYKLSGDTVKFADSSLLSYGDKIYVTSRNSLFPVDSPETFLSKGFVWEDVIPVTPTELETYTQEKNFTIASLHPDGTIFKTMESGNFYAIADGKKHLLPSANVAKSWLKKTPVAVSSRSLGLFNNCEFQKSFWGPRIYTCEIPIENMQDLLGSDYIFSIRPKSAIQIDTIQVEFKKDISWRNFRLTVSTILNRVKNNYVPAN